jgi:DNA-binding transcriptional ArsR family regulator
MTSSDPNPPTGVATPTALSPVAVYAALASETRLAMLALLADGVPRSATDLTAAMGRSFDAVTPHLHQLHDAGLLTAVPGADRRQLLFSVPPEFRREAGVLDFGLARLPMPSARPAVAKD